MKKVILMLLLVMCLGAGSARSIWPFGAGLSYKKTVARFDKIEASLAKISDVQLSMNNQLTAMMTIAASLEMNVTNEMRAQFRAQLNAFAAANVEVKGMIGSVDASLKQNQSVGSGILTNITTDPKMVTIIFITMGVIIIALIAALVIVFVMSLNKDKKVLNVESEKKKFKQISYEIKAQHDKLVTALAKNPDITLDFTGKVHNGVD